MRRFLGPQRGLEAIAKQFMVLWAALMRELAEICWKRQRMRCRRLTMYRTDPNRPQGDLLGRDRQDLTGAAAMEHGVVGRELKKYFFLPPKKCSIDLFGPLAN